MCLFYTAYVLWISFINTYGGCVNDDDCYLRGSCENSKCICDYWAIGENCQYLNLSPINKSQIGYKNSSGYSSWGANVVYYDNKYHLFASQFVNYCYVTSYKHSSQIIRAESDNPFGPFIMKQIVFPVFAHNPQIVQLKNGTYLIYYIGQKYSQNQTLNCTQNKPRNLNQFSFINVTNDSNSIEMVMPGEGPINVASSNTVYGPWNSHIIVDDQNIQQQYSTNPAPYIFGNDSVLLAVRRRWCNGKENVVNASKCMNGQQYDDTYLMYADQWDGKYINKTLYPYGQLFDCEDDFIFETKRGYHMLQHYQGTKFGSWFAYSHDGINWNQVKINTYNATVKYTDGTQETLCVRERPQIYFNANGDFIALITGVMGQVPNCPYGQAPTYTLIQPFSTLQYPKKH